MTSPVLFEGIVDPRKRVREAISGGANVVMVSRGCVRQVVDELVRDTSVALMLTASAAGRPQGPVVTPIGSVEETLRIGADAVVVFAALAGETEPEMISYLSKVGEDCEHLGMPLIAEAEYPTTYQSLESLTEQYGLDYLKRNARLCAELGADIVKVNWSGDTEFFAEIVEGTGVPVVVAGGPVVSDQELLVRMEQAKKAGAIGCSVGRNIFEHEKPEAITRAIVQVFREGKTGQEAYVDLQARLGRGGM